MDSRSVVFLQVMIAVAVVGVIAFGVYLIVDHGRRRRAGADAKPAPRGYEFILAALVLIVIVAVVAWQFPLALDSDATAGDWRTDGRSVLFFVIMLVLAGLGLVAFLVFVFMRSATTARDDDRPAAAASAAPAADVVETSPASGLIGIAVLGLAFLILNWAYVSRADQFALMVHLMYPAALAVALVLMFDKATRTWSAKGKIETFREWMFCDGIVFLLFLSYLNLWQSAAGDKYASMFWDFLVIVLFILTFWILDRKATRYRFLLAYAYLFLLPIGLLIWRNVQGVVVPEDIDISWWSTVWPFFTISVVFFILEIICLVAVRDDGPQTVPAVKDGLFIVLYVILLIAAIPEAAT